MWKLDGFEKSTVSVSFGLGSLTNVTGLDEGFDGLGKARERVSAFHKISCFGCAPVSGKDTRMVVAKYLLYPGLGYDDSVDFSETASGKMGVVKQSAICFEIFDSKSGISFVVCKPRILVLDQWTNAGQGIIRCVGSARNVLEGDVVLLHNCEPAYKPRRKVRVVFQCRRAMLSVCATILVPCT